MMMLYVFEIKLKLLMRPYKKPVNKINNLKYIELKVQQKVQKFAPTNYWVKGTQKMKVESSITSGEKILSPMALKNELSAMG